MCVKLRELYPASLPIIMVTANADDDNFLQAPPASLPLPACLPACVRACVNACVRVRVFVRVCMHGRACVRARVCV